MIEEQKSATSIPISELHEVDPLLNTKGGLEDEEETAKLKILLKEEFKIEEREDMSSLFAQVLTALRKIIKDWVYSIAIKRKQPPEIAEKAGGGLFTSGSFRLGVHGGSSDIDALCVVPRFVDREEDFFGDFLETLKKIPEITDLREIKEAHVPLVKMKFSGVDIDLLFARIRYDTVNESLGFLQDDDVLQECDEKSIISLNAIRNNDLIMELVPNRESFRITLKCIKVWAKNRDLYCNKIGYLGGISWAILVAKICQLYPYLGPNKLLEKLFYAFHKWKWKVPVLLRSINEPIGFTQKNWNQKNCESDQQHLMPIITPAFPSVNSAFNVSKTTKRIVIEELYRAARIAKKINEHRPKYNWMALFKKYNFFKEFSHYFRIDALSQDKNEHLKWKGFVESKLRMLILELENHPDIDNIRPFTKPYTLVDPEYQCCTTFLIGFKFKDPAQQKKQPNYNQEYIVDLREPILKFCEKITAFSHRLGNSLNMRVTHVTREKLPNEVFEDGVRPHYTKVKKHSEKKIEDPNDL